MEKRLRKGMIVKITKSNDFLSFLRYLEHNTKIKWITGARAMNFSEDKFTATEDFCIVVIPGRGNCCLQYSSLKFYKDHRDEYPYEIITYERLFSTIRRF